MAASVTKQYKVELGPMSAEFIFIDANDATSLANVPTHLATPFGCILFEISHTDRTTNDSQTKAGTPLAVFSGAATPTSKLIDCSGMTAAKHYQLFVVGF